jgi:hypothetical protein
VLALGDLHPGADDSQLMVEAGDVLDGQHSLSGELAEGVGELVQELQAAEAPGGGACELLEPLAPVQLPSIARPERLPAIHEE